MHQKRFLRELCSEKISPVQIKHNGLFFLKLKKFHDTFRTFLWGNNALMGFPVLKSGETYSILEKKKPLQKTFYLRRAYFSVDIFSMQVLLC